MSAKSRDDDVETELFVRVWGVKGLDSKYAGKAVFAKLSLNSVMHKTTVSHPVLNDSGQGADIADFQKCVFSGWGIKKISNLSYEDLLIVRVKYLGKLGRVKSLGVVSLAVRELSQLGKPDSKAWFPLVAYKGAESADGKICIGIYWGTEGDACGLLGSPSGKGKSMLMSRPRLMSDESLSTIGGMGVTSSRSVSSSLSSPFKTVSRLKTVFRKRHHKTQEMLVRSGAKQQGMTLSSTSVEKEPDTWHDAPIMNEDEETDVDDTEEEEEDDDQLKQVESKQDEKASKKETHSRPFGLFTMSPRRRQVVDKRLSIQELKQQKRAVLQVEIIEARGLLAADSNGLSDPYCILKVRQAKRKTQVIQKTLTPVWNQPFVFGGDNNSQEIISLDDIVTIIVKDKDNVGFDDDLGLIEIPLWGIAAKSEEVFRSKSLSGSTKLKDIAEDQFTEQPQTRTPSFRAGSLAEVDCVVTKPKWYSLHALPGMSTVRGEIKLGLAYFPGLQANTNEDKPSEEREKKKSRPFSAPMESITTMVQHSISPRHSSVEQKEELQEGDLFDEELSLFCSRRSKPWNRKHTLLKVHVLRGKNLKVADANGKSDPYCVVKVRHTKRQTEIKRKTLDPVWNETLEFGQYFLTENDVIDIKVRDYDRLVKDDDLGWLSIPIWSILEQNEGEPKWFAVKPVVQKTKASGSPSTSPVHAAGSTETATVLTPTVATSEGKELLGEIQLAFSFQVGDTTASLSPVTPKLDDIVTAKMNQYSNYKGKVWFYKMKINVISARDLPSNLDTGSLTSFVTVTCGDKTERTKIVKGSVNPLYKQRFTFEGSSAPSQRGLGRQDSIRISVRTPKIDKGDYLLDVVPSDAAGGQVIASTSINLGYVIDKMGYIDNDGMQLQASFELDVQRQNEEEEAVSFLDAATDAVNGIQVAKPRIKLSIKLFPVAQTRLMRRKKLVVRINRAKGLDEPGKNDLLRNVFLETHLGCFRDQSALFKMTHGYIVCHHVCYIDNLDALENKNGDTSLKINVCLEGTGRPIAKIAVPIHEIEAAPEKLLENWLPLTWNPVQELSESGDSPRKSNFAKITVDDAAIHASIKMCEVAEYLEPVLGNVDITLAKMKMDTNDFSYNLRLIIKYGTMQVQSEVHEGVVNVQFNATHAQYRFPVVDMFTPFVFEVWHICLHGGSRATRMLGSSIVTLYDLMEYESKAVFSYANITEIVDVPPVKIKFQDSKGKKVGSLRMNMLFEEDLLTGSLAPNTNPMFRSKKPFSVANLRHEINRTTALLNGFLYILGSFGYIVNWHNTKSSTFGLALLVLFCVLEFWTSHILVFVPLCALIYIANRHADRTFGAFAANLLQKSRIGENDVKARLLVTVVRGRNLVAMDKNGLSDPLVHFSIVDEKHGKVVESRIGRSRTVYETLDPDWSTSPIGFKASGGASLIQWRDSKDGSRIPAFEYFIPRHIHTRPMLEVIVAGTRGVIRGDIPASSSSSHKHFRCTIQPIPNSLLHALRSKDINPKGKGFSSAKFNSYLSRARTATTSSKRKIDKTSNGDIAPPFGFNKDIEQHEEPSRNRRLSTVSSCDSIEERDKLLSESGVSRRYLNEGDGSLSWLPRIRNPKGCPLGDDCPRNTCSPLEKNFVFEIKKNQAQELSPAQNTNPVRAYSNPKWNESILLGRDHMLTNGDVLLLTVTCGGGGSHDNHELAYAFVPVKNLLEQNSTEFINSWLPLEVPEPLDDQEGSEFVQWRIIGEILLSMRVHGMYNIDRSLKQDEPREEVLPRRRKKHKHTPKTPIVEDPELVLEKEMIISTAQTNEEPDEPWSCSSAQVFLDVFDEDNFSKRDFIGRVRFPLGALVSNDGAQEQPIFEEWLPLSFRFDGNKADNVLWFAARGEDYAAQSTFDRITTGKSRSGQRSSFGSSLPNFMRRSVGPRSSDETSVYSEGETGRSGSFGAESDAERHDMAFDWLRSGPPLGEILVRAQLVLPDPGAEDAFEAAEEAKKADKGGIIEQSRLIFRKLQMVQDWLYGVNNTLEQVKNLFNWTHPRKTKFIMLVTLLLLVLFLVIPSRYIVLMLGIYFFTERFRPLGVVLIKLKHLVALIPTNDDLVNLYMHGPLLGSFEQNVASSARFAGPDSSIEAVSKLTGKKFYQGMRDKYMTLGLRNQMIQNKSREAQGTQKIIAENDCKAFGYLRSLQRHRGKAFKRYYFAIAHNQLLCWQEKVDLLVQVAFGALGEVRKVEPIEPDSEDANFLQKKGVSRGTLECTFVIIHPERFRLRLDGSVAATPGVDSSTSTSTFGSAPVLSITNPLHKPHKKKRPDASMSTMISTYMVANSKEKRDFWIQNIRAHCMANRKLSVLL